MLDSQSIARARAIDEIFRRTMLARPNSRDYVNSLLEAADSVASIDGVLFERTAREACLVAEAIQLWDLFAKALSQRAWALFRSGNLGVALLSAEQAAHIARQRAESRLLNVALYTVASIRGRIGDFDAAERIWQGVISSVQASGDSEFEARSRQMYGLLLWEREHHARAIAQHTAAYTLFRRSESTMQAQAANNAALAALGLRQFDVANQWISKALLECPPDAALWQSQFAHTQGLLALAQDRPDAAREAFARALTALTNERDDVSHSANLYLDIGRLHSAEGSAQKAFAPLDHALTLAQDSGDSALVARVHDALHDAYEKIGDFTSALRHCRSRGAALIRMAETKSAEQVAVLKAAESLVHERARWSAIRYDA
jgi:tetratricopeptide (TPR) repeat protein